MTDVDGKYSISAKDEDVLVFSFIGFVSQEAQVGQKTSID
ncbi:MAG: carboxypeptidase-like regulatory domain-containing protein, partial [Flammeovirgaceae bacterium]|nr:carboxypeptidase-like regulatory domain-containing protein [Flammeovirgaceae bacterium]